jgi:hypothetical protein
MPRILASLAAVFFLLVIALPTPGSAAQREPGITKSESTDLSSRRRNVRRHYRSYRVYRYRPYYQPYYRPYYYRPYYGPYYWAPRPFPFPFGPLWW